MPKVRWVVSYGFCSKFHTLSSGAKILKMVKIIQSYSRQFKGENFFEDTVYIAVLNEDCCLTAVVCQAYVCLLSSCSNSGIQSEF